MLADQLGHPEGRIHGLTTYLATHLSALSEAVALNVCFLSNRHPAAESLEASGVSPTFFGRSKWDVRTVYDIALAAKSLRPELLHLIGEKSFIVGSLVARALGIPSVLHIHDAIALRPPLRPLQRRLSRSVDLAVVISEEIRGHAVDEYGFAPEQVRVVLHGIDLDRFSAVPAASRSRMRNELSVDDNIPLIAVIGRINRDKGQLQAIEAMSRIVEERPDARLLVVGDGPGRQECEAAAAARGLSGQVTFTGQCADIPSMLAASDLVLVPSMWYEAFGFVPLEAIAAGRPVVAFDSGGIRNTVVHDRTGVLVPRGDVAALARETVALLSDPARVRRYRDAGRNHLARFTIRAHVAALLAIYQELLSAREPALG
jgi:glycosyltransferase involved in cell wall biosynthesis